jgi:Mini-chromosome maintenance replisome factor
VAPRIHCISFRRLGSSFPLLYPVHLKNASSKVSYKEYSNSLWGSQPAVRTERTLDHIASKQLALDHITKALGGDSLAAEYALLAVLSRLYNREEESLLLGSLSVNLCGMARGDGRVAALKRAIADFVPLCVQVLNRLRNTVTVKPF